MGQWCVCRLTHSLQLDLKSTSSAKMLEMLGVYCLWKTAPTWTFQWLSCLGERAPNTIHIATFWPQNHSGSFLLAHVKSEIFSSGFKEFWASLIWCGITIFHCLLFLKTPLIKGFLTHAQTQTNRIGLFTDRMAYNIFRQIALDRLTAAFLPPVSFWTAQQINFPSLGESQLERSPITRLQAALAGTLSLILLHCSEK